MSETDDHAGDAAAPALRLPATTVPDPSTAPGLRWGVIAPGNIAASFTAAAHRATDSRVVSVASRSARRAEEFAARFGVEQAFSAVTEMLEAAGLDAVYVASPHTLHHQHARAVLEAGVPVLVEKPFTLNGPQARDLLELARGRGVFAMEAMWTRFLPQHDVLRQVLATGELGEIIEVAADHGQLFAEDPAHRLFAPELGGGALLDLGVYPVSFAQMVLGDLDDLAARAELTSTGVDASMVMVARGAHGGLARLSTTLRSRTPTEAVVVGARGTARLSGSFYAPGTLTVTLHDGRTGTFHHPGAREDGMAYEIAETARRITAGQLESPLMSWEDTLSVMDTMDTARAACGIVHPGEETP